MKFITTALTVVVGLRFKPKINILKRHREGTKCMGVREWRWCGKIKMDLWQHLKWENNNNK